MHSKDKNIEKIEIYEFQSLGQNHRLGRIRHCRYLISAHDGALVESVGLRRVYRYII
jgi:hypothetical protein